MKIICVGECTVDHYLDLQEQYVGGISLNFAVHSKRCGAEQVSVVSCVGTDTAGVQVLDKLSRERIDASHIVSLPGKTARQDIRLIEGGERVFPSGGFQVGVLASFQLRETDLTFIHHHDILAAPLYSQIEPLFIQVIKDSCFQGKRVADFLDASDYTAGDNPKEVIETYLDHLDLIFISGTQTTIDALRPLSPHYQGLIVITLGAEGSIALSQGRQIYQPAIAVAAPIDSTGCGDAFQATFTTTYFQTGNIQEALYRGATQAAQVLQHYGAVGA